MNNSEINKKLLSLLPSKQKQEVFDQKNCDIDGSFMGFVEIYYHLSKIIPLHWTIIDFGCAYAPQCFYFDKHKKYIGVDMSDCVKFHARNTKHYTMESLEFVDKYMSKIDVNNTFAICSYVPPWGKVATDLVVKRNFRNCFVFYPSTNME